MRFLFIIFLTLLFQIALKGNILLVALYGLHLQATPTILGVIIASTSLLPMLLASIVGRLADQISNHLLLATGMIGSGLALGGIYFLEESIWVLLIVQFFFGFFQIIAVVSSQNFIGGLSSEATRAKNFSLYTLSVSIANFIGPLLVGLFIDLFHYPVTYLFLAICAIVPGLCFLFLPIKKTSPAPSRKEKDVRFLQLLLHPQLRRVFVTSGIILTGVGLFEFYFPIYMNSLQLSATIIGIITGINAIGFIISRLLMQPLQKRFTPEQIIGGCLLIAGASFFLIPFIQTVPVLALLSLVVGLGLGCCQPLSIVMAYNASPAGHSGEVLGIRLTVNKAVQFAVPIIFGGISFLGFFPIFWFNSVLLFFSGSSLLQLLQYKKTAPKDSTD